MVQTGPIVATFLPSRSRLRRPRSTASATASDCGNVKLTVARDGKLGRDLDLVLSWNIVVKKNAPLAFPHVAMEQNFERRS
jgi:hypothetical protein